MLNKKKNNKQSRIVLFKFGIKKQIFMNKNQLKALKAASKYVPFQQLAISR